MKRVEEVVRRQVYNTVLRLVQMSYLKVAVATWMGLKGFSIDSRDQMINSWVAIAGAVYIVVTPVAMYLFIKKNQAFLGEAEFSSKFSSLYLGVNLDNT